MKTIIVILFVAALAFLAIVLKMDLPKSAIALSSIFVGYTTALMVLVLPGKALLNSHIQKIEKLEDDLGNG